MLKKLTGTHQDPRNEKNYTSLAGPWCSEPWRAVVPLSHLCRLIHVMRVSTGQALLWIIVQEMAKETLGPEFLLSSAYRGPVWI